MYLYRDTFFWCCGSTLASDAYGAFWGFNIDNQLWVFLAVRDKKQSTVSHLNIFWVPKQFAWYAANFISSAYHVLLPITALSINKFGTNEKIECRVKTWHLSCFLALKIHKCGTCIHLYSTTYVIVCTEIEVTHNPILQSTYFSCKQEAFFEPLHSCKHYDYAR